MSSMNRHHQEIVNGKGRCSVPMWMGGLPSGFCDRPAYGRQPLPEIVRPSYRYRMPDPSAPPYAPGLACESHHGPSLKEHIKGKTVLRFSKPPGPDSEFIEAECDGASVSVGAWLADGDHWLLVLPPTTPTEGK